MLPIHEYIVGELVQEEDGLVVMGAGLGLAKVLACLLRLHVASHGVVFILSASDAQRNAINEEILQQDPGALPPSDINSDYTDRHSFYSEGGSCYITSRILIVDLLNERIPLHRIAGLVILNAHRLSDTCTEAFIARLYRSGNKKGFIRAFSDKPQAMVSGFAKAERIMRSLYVRKLHLWPRFHLSIAAALEENPPHVVDLRVPLTSFMQSMNAAILEVMDICLKELRKTNKVDIEDLTIENGLFKSFDEIIKRQLDPIWHVLGRKTKQLVSALTTLRKLADYLVRYDSVTFLKYLDTLRASEDVRSVWIFANPTHKIFELAKKRVFQVIRTDGGATVKKDILEKQSNVGSLAASEGEDGKRRRITVVDNNNSTVSTTMKDGVEVVVVTEEMPKWKVFREVLEEIQQEVLLSESSNKGSSDSWDQSAGIVLVACKDERTCLQLQDIINKGPQKLMLEQWENYLLGKAELHGMRTRKKRIPSAPKGFGILNGRSHVKNVLMESGNSSRHEEDALLAAAAEVIVPNEDLTVPTGGRSKRGGRAQGRGRGRGRKTASGRGKQNAKVITDSSDLDTINSSIEGPSASASAASAGEASFLSIDRKDVTDKAEDRRPFPPVQFYAVESDQQILNILKPSFVVVYDPDMAFVREMEIYKAEHTQIPLKVYFLFYDNSIEAQKFEASIRRENNAFESLIRQKATMMIPVEQDGRLLDVIPTPQSPLTPSANSLTRKAGGRKGPEKQMQIVVDMREFGSSLPCVLHQQGMKILPVTLEVGDYILSPEICVERKSVSDLFASFASGRLFHQAETMTRYYRIPVLLIEFSQDKSFSFQSAAEVGDEINPTNIVSKLSLLVLHFPRLRIVWSRSLHATADIFMTLKSNQDEPDVEKAMRIGVPTEDGLIEGDTRAENYNTVAIELLRRLPGVTDANYRTLMDGCNSLAELACLPVEKLTELMGGQRPAKMLREFLDAKCPNLG